MSKAVRGAVFIPLPLYLPADRGQEFKTTKMLNKLTRPLEG